MLRKRGLLLCCTHINAALTQLLSYPNPLSPNLPPIYHPPPSPIPSTPRSSFTPHHPHTTARLLRSPATAHPHLLSPESYVSRAKDLLASSAAGTNPFDGFVPEVPAGERLTVDTDAFHGMEAKGMSEMAGACFVLVAGGLGERLGYNGIKVELPSEITTETSYV